MTGDRQPVHATKGRASLRAGPVRRLARRRTCLASDRRTGRLHHDRRLREFRHADAERQSQPDGVLE